MRRYLFLFILLFVSIGQLCAQDVSFVTNAPNTVVEGAQFQLQYVLKNAQGESIEDPQNIDGFEVMFGPSKSTMYSSTYINGKSSSERSTTYTYLLVANKAGTFTLPGTKVKADGKNYSSKSVTIKVLPPDESAEPTEPGRQPKAISSSSTGDKFNPKDAFIRAIFSRTKVNEQEAVVVTFRFYTVLTISDVSKIEFPEFEGFMTEEFDLPTNRQWQMEHYQGKNYMMLDVKKSLLFPQRSGKITIPSGNMEITFQVSSGQRINHPLFGPQDIMTETKRNLRTNPVTVDVSPLPDGKPIGFSGGVGSFTVKSSLNETQVKANDAVTLQVQISGVGNMKLIKNPTLELDKNIEIYDPKVDNNFKITERGLSGTKTIEYLFIPRYPGVYKIPPISFSYYDPSSKSYKTTSTQEYTLNVAPDPNAGSRNEATSYMGQKEVKVDKDIRYLKTGKYKFIDAREFTVESAGYILWYILPVMLLFALVIIYRKQIKANADIARMRNKKANKIASKRLRVAAKHLTENNKEGFYEEILRAVWGYLSDKLTIPVAELNRENVESELTRYGAANELIVKFIHILDTCEFARYAPVDSDDAMGNLYDKTVQAIDEMESTIKIK